MAGDSVDATGAAAPAVSSNGAGGEGAAASKGEPPVPSSAAAPAAPLEPAEAADAATAAAGAAAARAAAPPAAAAPEAPTSAAELAAPQQKASDPASAVAANFANDDDRGGGASFRRKRKRQLEAALPNCLETFVDSITALPPPNPRLPRHATLGSSQRYYSGLLLKLKPNSSADPTTTAASTTTAIIGDVVLNCHPNGLVVLCVAPTHPLATGASRPIRATFPRHRGGAGVGASGAHKRKAGMGAVYPNSVVCRIEFEAVATAGSGATATSGGDGSCGGGGNSTGAGGDGGDGGGGGGAPPSTGFCELPACMAGDLMEVNDALLQEPGLIAAAPLGRGYIAILRPPAREAEAIKAQLTALGLEAGTRWEGEPGSAGGGGGGD